MSGLRTGRGTGFRREYVPVIFSLAGPTMLEELVDTAVQYIDTAMVGSLGTEATAAVGSTATVNWLVGGTVSAIGIGFLSYIAKAFGAKDRQRASAAAAQAVITAFAIGILFTALILPLAGRVPVWMRVDETIRDTAGRYFFILYTTMLFRCLRIIFGAVLRASGDTKTPMRVGLAVNAANILGNFLLIYPGRAVTVFGQRVFIPGAGLGVTGAAAASAAAIGLGGVCMTAALWRHPELSPRGKRLLPDRAVLFPCLKVAGPAMLQRFCTSLGYVVFASTINSLGETATAAHTIANTVESAFYIPGYGMQSATATLTGNCIGARDRRKMQEIGQTVIVLEVLMMLLSGGLLFVYAPAMMRIFSSDSQVILTGGTVLRMVALSEPFYGVSIVTEGMLMGAGETLMPFIFSAGTMWGIRIVGTVICVKVFGLGLIAAWACMIANNLLLLLCLRLYYRYGKWTRRIWGEVPECVPRKDRKTADKQ